MVSVQSRGNLLKDLVELENLTIKEIARLQADCFDMMTMSSKKDAIVNIGGFVATRHAEIYDSIKKFLGKGK